MLTMWAQQHGRLNLNKERGRMAAWQRWVRAMHGTARRYGALLALALLATACASGTHVAPARDARSGPVGTVAPASAAVALNAIAEERDPRDPSVTAGGGE